MITGLLHHMKRVDIKRGGREEGRGGGGGGKGGGGGSTHLLHLYDIYII
jgi:hypothetical protein